MAQAQPYSNVLNMAFMLPVQEQRQLIRDVQDYLNHHKEADLHPYSWEELRANIREAEEQIASGKCYSSEEDDQMFDEFIANELKVAL